METLRGKRVLVMGLGRFGGGVGVSRWLVEQGAQVTVTDVARAEDLAASMAQLAGLPIAYKLGGHDAADFISADLVVTNPAVDKTKSGFVQAAVRAGVALTTELNLFLERCQGFTIGITGSVGKSTTTMLIYLAVRAGLGISGEEGDGRGGGRVFLGGNIGKSLLGELPRIRAQDVVVLEVSSFMLEDTPAIRWSPRMAVVTNLFPNHLDRHGTLAEYAAAKLNLLEFQGPGDVCILNGDHDLVRRWADLAKGRVVKFTTRGPGKMDMVMPGEHNQSNGRAALAVVEALAADGRFGTLDMGAARAAIGGFAGLEHRLQLVHTSIVAGGTRVRWINDSKATTPEASMTALEAFQEGEAIVIVGGYDKHSEMSAFEGLMARRAAGVLGIGQTGAGMVERVSALQPIAGQRVAYVETLERAVEQARIWAGEIGAKRRGGRVAVLLSPACASWGQFKNYEERGEMFARLARAEESGVGGPG